MPNRPRRPCADCHPTHTGPPCPHHQTLRNRTRERNRNRPTRQQRGLDAAHYRNGTAAIHTWVTAHGWTCPGWNTPPHPVPPGGLTRDHTLPRSQGGTNHPDNYTPLCAACNRHKGARHP